MFEFESFYLSCLRHEVKPEKIFIEKKSTGGMLLGFLRQRQGLVLIDVKRDAGSGSKTSRFHRVAPYVSRGLLSINLDCQYLKKFITHLNGITFEESQKTDDIADTMADAIVFALIDKIIYNNQNKSQNSEKANKILASNRQRRLAAGNGYSRRI